MSTGAKFGRPWRRRHVIGATTIVALVVSLLTLGSASARQVAQHRSGDASAAGSAMSSTHSLSRAQRHASLVSGHAAHHSLLTSSFLPSALFRSLGGSSQPLAPITGCGAAARNDRRRLRIRGRGRQPQDRNGRLHRLEQLHADLERAWDGAAPDGHPTATASERVSRSPARPTGSTRSSTTSMRAA